KAHLDVLAWRVSQKHMPIAELCMLKVHATTALEWVANEAMQILGGAGYLRGSKVERIYRETKVLTIGGGSAEIMKDLAARQLGYARDRRQLPRPRALRSRHRGVAASRDESADDWRRLCRDHEGSCGEADGL